MRYAAAELVASLEPRVSAPIEAAGSNIGHLVMLRPGSTPMHGFLEAVHAAFDQHLPLVLSPDDVWLCVAQGFAYHVEANAEALRGRFVRHEGKVELRLERHGFTPGDPNNDWPGVFAELSDQIAAHIGKQRELVVAGFSTTGPIERAASQVVLLAGMQAYFEVKMYTLCGIPSVTLLGTVDDWRAIRRRAEMLAEYGAAEWQAALLPILDHFVAAAQGRADRAFWQSMYKLEGRSGGPFITGWVNALFPYLTSEGRRGGAADAAVPNLAMTAWQDKDPQRFGGTRALAFPSGVMRAPFTWRVGTQTRRMSFRGGFCGVAQEPSSGAMRPAIGWAVTWG